MSNSEDFETIKAEFLKWTAAVYELIGDRVKDVVAELKKKVDDNE